MEAKTPDDPLPTRSTLNSGGSAMKLAILHPFQLELARGIERFTWSLGCTFARRGLEVDLLTWQSQHPIVWGELPPGMRIRQVPGLRYFMSRIAIPFYFGWLAKERYDWVMLYFAGYGEAEAMTLLRRFRPQKYCVVFHFPRQQVPHRYAEFERFGLARGADRLVAVSRFVKNGVEVQFGKPCSVIPVGVDTDVFSPSAALRTASRERLGMRSDTPQLVTLAALEERKGIQWVIRAIPRLLGDFPDLHYHVLGEGAYRQALEGEIRQHGLADRVHLIGNTTDVVSYLAAADVSCLLSVGEAFPLTLVESMAMELPVITSRHPPYDDLVTPEWGVTVDETDIGAVAREIGALLRDPECRRTLGQAGRQQVMDHYTWPRAADEYVRLFAIT